MLISFSPLPTLLLATAVVETWTSDFLLLLQSNNTPLGCWNVLIIKSVAGVIYYVGFF